MKKRNMPILLLAAAILTVPLWAQAQEQPEPVELNGMSWQVTVRQVQEPGGSEQDNLVFAEDKFSSQNFSSQGFVPVAYNLRLAGNGGTIWEAMQVNQDGEKLFWRGDVDPLSLQLRGVLVQQSASGASRNFNFTSSGN